MQVVLIAMTIIILIVAVAATLILYRTQQDNAARLKAEQKTWEHAQEAQRQQWVEQQEKYAAQRIQQLQQNEERLASQVKELMDEVQTRKDEEQARLEHTLSHLPRVEDMPLSGQLTNTGTMNAIQQLKLKELDLTGRDFSHRYLGHMDLNNVQLAKTNLFMADLSHSTLKGANLRNADLSGANLTHADFRGANLSGANFMVTDLNNANLIGTILTGARNLTSEQIATAIVDHTTQFDEMTDITLPGIPSIPNGHQAEKRTTSQLAIEEF